MICRAHVGVACAHPARLALLDDAFAGRVKPWPQISHALLARVREAPIWTPSARSPRSRARRCSSRCCSGTWRGGGAGQPGGIRLGLPLTHRLLGRLVGASARRLARTVAARGAGLVTGRDGALHLRHRRSTWPLAPAERTPQATPTPRSAREEEQSTSPARPGVRRMIVHVLWLTSGLSCDGVSLADGSAS
jgi:hypothetical protein